MVEMQAIQVDQRGLNSSPGEAIVVVIQVHEMEFQVCPIVLVLEIVKYRYCQGFGGGFCARV